MRATRLARFRRHTRRRTHAPGTSPNGPPSHQGNRRVSSHENTVRPSGVSTQGEPTVAGDDPRVAHPDDSRLVPLGDRHAVGELDRPEAGLALERGADTTRLRRGESDGGRIFHPLDMIGDVAHDLPDSGGRRVDLGADEDARHSADGLAELRRRELGRRDVDHARPCLARTRRRSRASARCARASGTGGRGGMGPCGRRGCRRRRRADDAAGACASRSTSPARRQVGFGRGREVRVVLLRDDQHLVGRAAPVRADHDDARRRRARRGCRSASSASTVAHSRQLPSNRPKPASSSRIAPGTNGMPRSCACGCASDAPASRPWLTIACVYRTTGCDACSSMRSRTAPITSAVGAIVEVGERTRVLAVTARAPRGCRSPAPR